jgi:hypothetical protein
MDFTRLAILGIMDVLLLAELTFSIWLSHFKPESFTQTFLVWFVPLAGLTVVLARLALKRLARLRAAQDPASRPGDHRFQPVGLFGRNLPPGPSGR